MLEKFIPHSSSSTPTIEKNLDKEKKILQIKFYYYFDRFYSFWKIDQIEQEIPSAQRNEEKNLFFFSCLGESVCRVGKLNCFETMRNIHFHHVMIIA